MAAIGTLVDPFNLTALQTDLWTEFTGGSATMTYTGNGVVVSFPQASTSSTDGDISSDTTYDLTGSSIYLNVIQVPNSGTNANAVLRVAQDGTNYYRWVFEAGTLYAQRVIAGATTTVTPDGLEGNWVNRGTFTNVLTLTAMTVLIAGVCYQNETAPGKFIFRYLNTRRSGGPSFDAPHLDVGSGMSRTDIAN